MASNANEKYFTAFSSNNHAYENIHQSADDPIACLSQAWGRRSKIKAKIPGWLPRTIKFLLYYYLRLPLFSASAACIRLCLCTALVYLLLTRTRCHLVYDTIEAYEHCAQELLDSKRCDSILDDSTRPNCKQAAPQSSTISYQILSVYQ